MTTEEIEKAASDYSKSLEPIAFENLKGEEMPYLLRGAFKEGLEFANRYWQEKTALNIADVMFSFLNFVQEQKPTMVNHGEKNKLV